MIMKQSINVNGAPAAVGPYVHAVKTGNMIFISGQLGYYWELLWYSLCKQDLQWLKLDLLEQKTQVTL